MGAQQISCYFSHTKNWSLSDPESKLLIPDPDPQHWLFQPFVGVPGKPPNLEYFADQIFKNILCGVWYPYFVKRKQSSNVIGNMIIGDFLPT